MRVGLFYPGPWVPGGSERHFLGIASHAASTAGAEVMTFVPGPWAELGRKLHLDLSAVRFRVIPESSADALGALTESYDLWVNGSPWHIIPSRCRKSVLLAVYPPPFRSRRIDGLRRAVGRGLKSIVTQPPLERVASKIAPGFTGRLMRVSAVGPADALATYHLILANSEFTRRLVRRRWGRDSEVLYPPVDTESLKPLPKRPIILSVGRFGWGGNNKKHFVLIETFRRLLARGLTGWELHLAGATHDAARDRAYFEQVQRAASGCPIVIHADCAHERLHRLYGESAIYWHGAGYGEDEVRDPLAVEHFGIATVEAMAAGCVPIVCGKGGQPEIVSHAENGFLWNTLAELEQHTLRTVDHPELANRLRANAIQRSRQFSMHQFARRLAGILSGLYAPDFALS